MTKANGDIQAVILIGPGDRLYPFVDEASPCPGNNLMPSSLTPVSITSSSMGLSTIPSAGSLSTTTTQSTANSSLIGSSSTNYCKGLLPICNRPLIYYPLTWLIQSGIGEIFIVVQQKSYGKVAYYVHKQYEFAEDTKIEVVPIPVYDGSLSALMSVRNRLKSDFLVVGCDLITDSPLSRMTDLHRSKNALFTCLFTGPQASGLMSSGNNSTPASGANDSSLTDPRYLASLAGEELLVALDMSTLVPSTSAGNTSTCDLIYCAPQADSLDETNSFLPIKMSTLCRHPRMRLRTDLLDPHCYLFSQEIFKVIEDIISTRGASTELERLHSLIPASLFSIREDLIPKVLRRVHRFHNSEGINNSRPASTFAFIVDSGHYCMRANTLPALLEASRQLMKSLPTTAGNNFTRVASSAEISSRSQVGNDSMFGEASRLGERSSVKKSVVGNNCTIGNNVKVVNCIIMDGVIIEDGCKLEGCIVGPKSVIKDKSQLKDCDISGGFSLDRETTAKSETFGSNRELVEDLY